MKTMIIMRGLPGSGKSSLAKELVGDTGLICSSDTFMTEGRQYKFRPERLAETHEACQRLAAQACRANISPVVIDNTNIKKGHINPYLKIAKKFGYKVEYRQPETPWARDPEQCFAKCVHNVPLEAIQRMLREWEQ